MSAFDTAVRLVYLAAAVGFVVGLRLMNTPRTARRGNQLSALGMLAAVGATVALVAHGRQVSAVGWVVLVSGVTVGSIGGGYAARVVPMTAMPQLVSLFNAAGGGAAAAIGMYDVMTLEGSRASLASVLDVVIGAVTFSGSLVAAGKLQGMVTGRPVALPATRAASAVLVAVVLLAGTYLLAARGDDAVLVVLALAAAAAGVVLVVPIGGADMPVVISLLNAFTGTAVAMAGFVLDNSMLIIAGGWWARPGRSSRC